MKIITRPTTFLIRSMQITTTTLLKWFGWATGFVRVSTRDEPILDGKKRYLFVANHRSYVDVYGIFLGLSFKNLYRAAPTRFMTGAWIYYSLIRPIVMWGGGYPAKKPASASYDAVDQSIEYIRSGQNVVIFPEAKITTRTEAKPRPGVVRIINQCDVPLEVILVNLQWERISYLRRNLVATYSTCRDTRTPESIMQQIYDLEP